MGREGEDLGGKNECAFEHVKFEVHPGTMIDPEQRYARDLEKLMTKDKILKHFNEQRRIYNMTRS